MPRPILEISATGIQDVLNRLDSSKHRLALKTGMQRVAVLLKGSIQILTPRKTGFLASQYKTNVYFQGNDVIARVYNPVFYGPYVDVGTGIFVGRDFIRPKRSRFLRFEINGQVFYRRFVRGQRGQHFVDRGIQNAKPKLNPVIIKEIQRVLNGD